MNERERIIKLVDDAASSLLEHCDSVRIFVTMPSQDTALNTASYSSGRGNYHAQVGQIKEFIIRDDERIRIDENSDVEI